MLYSRSTALYYQHLSRTLAAQRVFNKLREHIKPFVGPTLRKEKVSNVKFVLFVILSTLLIVGCSSKPSKTAHIDNRDDKTTEKKTVVEYETEKPTSFAEYKKWRQANDPASEAYAEYKRWEIDQRKWALENEK
jgi:hypothetical protein